jgi:hypothetical protein
MGRFNHYGERADSFWPGEIRDVGDVAIFPNHHRCFLMALRSVSDLLGRSWGKGFNLGRPIS